MVAGSSAADAQKVGSGFLCSKAFINSNLKELTRTLTRGDRIRRRPEFLRIQQQGKRTRGRYLTLFALPNTLDIDRLGVTATKRLGGATRRNRSKRLVRELFRQNKVLNRVGPSLDLVVLPRPGFCDVPYLTLQSDYLSALNRDARSR